MHLETHVSHTTTHARIDELNMTHDRQRHARLAISISSLFGIVNIVFIAHRFHEDLPSRWNRFKIGI
jgi:hypothetical protein